MSPSKEFDLLSHRGSGPPTRVRVYAADDSDSTMMLGFEVPGQGLGLRAEVWTTRAGLEALRDKLNAVLVSS